MLTPQEQEELDALENEFAPKPQATRSIAAPSRNPGDLSNLNIQVLSPDEEAELMALENEFAQRPNYNQENNNGILNNVGNAISSIGNAVDSYTGAPTRAAANALISGNNPISAFTGQFGEDPSLAPTGKEIAKKMGIDDTTGNVITNPKTGITSRTTKSDADIAGFGADIALDWTNALPFVNVSKLPGKTLKALKGSAAAADTMAGTKFVKTGEAIANTAEATAKATRESKLQLSKLFKPDIAPDFKETKKILEANGISTEFVPEALEFGDRSMVSRLARNTAEGPLGGDALEKHHKFLQDISGATENSIANVGGGVIPGKQDAGRVIREGFDKGVDEFFKGMDATYNNAIKLAPDMTLDNKSSKILSQKMAQMESWARQRIGSTKPFEKVLNNPASPKNAVNRATKETLDVLSSTNKAITNEGIEQAQQVLNAVQLAKNAMKTSGGNLKQVLVAMRDIGDIAFKSKNSLASTPADIKKFQELYFSLQKGATESMRTHLGDEFADALIKNNSEMSKFFSKRGPLADVIGKKGLADEHVFESLISRGNSKSIGDLKSIMPAEDFQKVKAAYLDSLVSRNADGVINFRTSRTIFNRKKEQLANVFTRAELQQIDDLLKVGDKAGQATLSSSGTGASNMFADIKGSLQNKIGGDVLLDNMKKGARQRANYVEVANSAPSGKASGFGRLSEKSPLNKHQATKSAQTYSTQERSERLQKYKQMRGL